MKAKRHERNSPYTYQLVCFADEHYGRYGGMGLPKWYGYDHEKNRVVFGWTKKECKRKLKGTWHGQDQD